MKNNFIQQFLASSPETLAGKKKICIIETKNNRYAACEVDQRHNYSHAETNALALLKMNRDTSGITSITVAGTGHDKLRRIIPCPSCFEALLPFLQKNGKLRLYYPNSFTRSKSIHFSSARKAFRKLKHSILRGTSLPFIRQQLKERTPLRGADVAFVADLRMLGLQKNIHFYLTGSKGGRSGLASLFTAKDFSRESDLDLVAVTSLSRKSVGKLVLALAANHYSSPRGSWKKKTIVLDTGARRRITYFVVSEKNRVLVELMVERSVEEGFTRFFNFDKNWFHQIS